MPRFFSLVLFLGYSVCCAQYDPYVESIPDTDLEIPMTVVPAGTFTMGSPESEAGRAADEGPQRTLEIEAFWMSETEITWQLYELFLRRGAPAPVASMERDSTATDSTDAHSGATVQLEADAVSGATVPYVDMSLGMGTGPGLPVGNVTRKAAARFCQWLSAKTGHFYRLPTEAEWEYAARAGSDSAYFFGSDPDSLDAYAWHAGNSEGKYHQVGQKKPNPWGLYDIYGNVAEWTLDGYDPAGYPEGDSLYVRPTKEYPGVLRGGTYKAEADALRSASRMISKPVWKDRDPQFPRSKWWFTDAPFAGFRIIRPVDPPPEETFAQFWDTE